MTEDRLLGGRVRLRQPVDGFRAALDPVLLAAAISAAVGARVLELGAGSGVATLCLAVRRPDLTLTGVEQQPDLVQLATENAALNAVSDRVRFEVGDVTEWAGRSNLPGGSGFDVAMANPPYLPAGQASLPANRSRRLAVGEGEAGLGAWIACAEACLRPRGVATLIYRADRLDRLLVQLDNRFGGIVVYPIWPRLGAPAKRVLVQARRGSRAPLRLSAGLVLHDAAGGFTAAAQAVLRDAAPIDLLADRTGVTARGRLED